MEDLKEVFNEANKCLKCKNAMCKKACPINTNIPEFIDEIKNNNFKKAYYILKKNNIMSYICSTVCPYEETCTGHCVKGIKSEPVNVHKLEKYVNNWANENDIVYKYEVKEQNNIKIAVIGSGPAGIACAVELATQGYKVTIFEKENFIGGLLSYGIPDFRLKRDAIVLLEKDLQNLNIEIIKKQEFGKDIDINSLKEKNYKAIFIGIGNEIPTVYSLTNEKCEKIYTADYILKEYNSKKVVNNLGKTIVIGGGNVATDSARAAIRMGAKNVTIIYRRSHEKMPARDVELQDAINDNIKIIYNTKVTKANLKEGILKSINCIKTNEEDGVLKEVLNSEFKMDTDSIIFAIGLKPNKRILENEGIQIENGLIKTNEFNQTNIEGVFAGGDVMQSKATVCMAIFEGKKAALSIINYIKFNS